MENNKKVRVDMTAGSRSYNRFEMQVSQVLHLAIELYDELNFLLILDHYDDITLFDLDADPLVVSYYQVKTSEDKMTIDSAIKGDWIVKLYEQLNRHEDWLVKELGLITNLPLEVEIKIISEKGKTHKITEKLRAERTSFTSLHESVQDRLKDDIATKLHIDKDEVDLSKFAHLRTTLSITSHRDLVEKEMSDFLYEKYPRITVDTVKSVFGAMIGLLSRRQSYESMAENARLEEVWKHKGVTRDDFNRVINQAITISIPEYPDVEKLLKPKEDEKLRVSLAYVTITTDSNKRNNQPLYDLIRIAQGEILRNPFDTSKEAIEYCQEVAGNIRKKNPILCVPYNDYYIPVLISCLLINEARR